MSKGAERSGALAPEAVWKCGATGSVAPRKGDLRLPEAAEETDDVWGQTASGAWAGTAQYPRSSSSSMLMAKPGTNAPVQSVADLLCHCLRQQPGRLLPGRPEHFWRDSSRQKCGGIAARLISTLEER